MTSQEVVQFAPGLAGSQLNELRLDGNKLGNTGVMALARHIRNCPLRSLDLSKNRITDVGVGALANALPASKLQVLDLSSQFIGDKGAGALAEALLKGSRLYDLRLHGNDVHLAGATSLAAALSTGVPLKRLSLTINLPSWSPGGLGQCIAKEPTAQSGIEDSVSSMWRGGGSGAPGSGVLKVLLISLHILSTFFHHFPVIQLARVSVRSAN